MTALFLLAPLLLTAVLIPLLSPPARRFGFVDRPDRRKHHDGAIPLIGGIAIFISFLPALIFATHHAYYPYVSLLLGLIVLLLIGVLDDLFALGSSTLFGAHIAAALIMIGIGNISINDLGKLLGDQIISLEFSQVPFTVFCAVGIINAINFVDGMDGLAGGIILIASLFFAVLAASAGLYWDSALLLLLASAIAGFLVFNLRHPWRAQAAVFLGNSGSMMLGFALCWFAIHLSQGDLRAYPPIVAVWIMGLPIIDTVSVMIRRIIMLKSPFSGDRQHLHHIMQGLGFSHSAVTFALLSISALLGAFGIAGTYMPLSDAVLFFIFLVLFIIYFVCSTMATFVLVERNKISL